MTRRRSILAVVFATILIDFVGFSALVPVLPLYGETIGASPSQVGMILAAHAVAQLLFLPAWGWVSDRVGRRPVLLVSLAGTSGSFVALALAESLEAVYVARLLSGFFAASVGAAQAVVADVTPDEDRARGMGLIGAAVGLGMVLGPAVGGLVAGFHPLAPFWAVAALSAANFLWASFALPETYTPPTGRARRRDLARLLVPAPLRLAAAVHDRRIALYLVVFLLVYIALGVMELNAPLALANLYGADVFEISLVFVCFAFVFVVTQGLLLGPLVARLGEPRLVAVGLAVMGTSFLAIFFAWSYAAYFPIVGCIGFGMGLAFPTFTSLFSQACESGQHGELLAESQAMGMTGRMIGPWAGGYVVEHVSYEAPFLGAALVTFAALALVRWARREMRVRGRRRTRSQVVTPP